MSKKGKKQRGDDLEFSREHQELKYLWDISQSLYQYLNVDDLILHIIKQITNVMYAEATSVILHDEGKDELVFCWSSDIPERLDKLEEIRIPVDHGIHGLVLDWERFKTHQTIDFFNAETAPLRAITPDVPPGDRESLYLEIPGREVVFTTTWRPRS